MPKTSKNFDDVVTNAVYTPSEVATYTADHIKRLQTKQSRAIALPIAGVRDYFAPTIAGQITAVIAQTSQYKSAFLHMWERMLAEQLMEQGRDKEIIIHVSVEECVEEQGLLSLSVESGEDVQNLARGQVQDWNKLMQSALRVGTIPIYRIGDSLARADDMPNLYLSNMIRSIEYLQNECLAWRPQIAGIFFDYLQAFPIDPEVKTAIHDQQRRLQVRNDIYRLRQASAKFDCPVVIAVQAKQKLDAPENWQMPDIYSGEESSAIGQRADRIICLWMPKMTHPIGNDIEYRNYYFKVEENLIFLKVGKQRGRLPSGRTWKCRIDFAKNMIAPEAEMTDGSLDGVSKRRH